ncbi:MAG TPA: carboxypeptidase regulatory-like domain-containing protein [Thermoanaerobaculia bacterium]|nr:carboxypeptidase regulatory-like domain-containing protein [Thermoanaerobaculia bacterium]
MERRPNPLVRAAWAALLVTLFAFSAFAQVQSGNIFGRVVSNDGAALPGVTVTLTGVSAPQVTVTDEAGNFRFLNLSPGTYTVKGELAGMGAATRAGIGVSIGQNASITITLNPSVSQTITVTAEAPLLDVRKTGTGTTLTKVELEQVPTGRDPWVILQQTPGVLMDRINVGGNESGQQSSYIGKGSTGDQSTWNVDGVNITDVGALGSSPTYYDFDSFEEMQVTTGGTDVRIQTPGVQLNMVTKRGTNDLKGSARYFATKNAWQSDPEIPTEATGYLARVNEIEDISDYGVEAGGPVIRDRLWAWGAYSSQQIDLLSATLLNSGARFIDATELETFNGKLNAQFGSSNSFSAAAMLGNKIKIGRNVGPTRAPETAWNQDSSYEGPTMWKVEDTHVFGPNFYLTGLFSKVQGGFQLIADAGEGCNTVDCNQGAPPPLFDEDLGSYFRNFYSYYTERPQTQYRGDGSAFFNTGSLSHELKFGFGYRDAKVSSLTAFPGGQFVNYNAAAGAYFVGLYRNTDFTYAVNTTDFYVGDTMLFGNLTVTAGLRWDNQAGSIEGGTVPANPVIPGVLPAITYGGSTKDIEWSSISPRIGLTYALGTERRTLLRAAANRYVDQLGGVTVYAASPLTYGYGYWYMVDLNNDRIAQGNEICLGNATDPAGCASLGSGLQFTGGSFDPNDLGSALPNTRWDPDINAPHTDELILGFETEVMPNLSVGVNGTYRRMDDFVTTLYERTRGSNNFYTRADYVLSGTPATGTGPDGSTYSLPYYVLDEDFSGLGVITNRPDYTQTYKGLELNATKRMADRWMLRGNISLTDWTQEVGEGAIVDPTRLRPVGAPASGCNICDGSNVVQGSGAGSGAKGGIYINSKWAFNLTGAYQIPVIETSLGFNLQGRQGYAIPYVHRQNTSEGFKYLLLDGDPADSRHDDITNLDLRLAKDFRFGPAGLTVSVDMFNVMNEQTILQRNTRMGIASGNRITELVSPRVFRLGARLTF